MNIDTLPDDELHDLHFGVEMELRRRHRMRTPHSHQTFCDWIMPMRNWLDHPSYAAQVVALGQATLNKGLPRFWHADEALEQVHASATPEAPPSQQAVLVAYMGMVP